MDKIVGKILDYKGALIKREKIKNLHSVSRKEFTLLLGGMASFRKVPGINRHMGFEELYHCESEADVKLVKAHLQKLYGIEDKESLLKTCYTIFAAGGEYEHFMTFWKSAPLFDISKLEPQGLKAFESCKYTAGYFYPFLKERGFYAYDISEGIVLCQVAVACGIISEEEFFDITDEWVRRAQVFYHSYEDFAISYMCGGIYDMSKYENTDLNQYLNLNIQVFDLLLKNNGAWQVNDWYKPEQKEWVDLIGHNLGCFITRRAMENECIGYMYHNEPTPNQPDSGWRFMYGDEDEEYLADVNNTTILALNTVCNLQPDILAFIHAEVGRSFELDETGWVED